MRYIRNANIIIVLTLITLTTACSDIKKELSGTARPDAGIAEQIPATKSFNASFESTWKAAQDTLDEHGILFEADKTNGKTVTVDKSLQNITGWKAMFAGSNYKAKQFIDIKRSADNQTSVKFSARFTKELATVFTTTNKEYPEAENMLRKSFFDELDKRLTSFPQPAPEAAPVQAAAPAPVKGKTKKK